MTARLLSWALLCLVARTAYPQAVVEGNVTLVRSSVAGAAVYLLRPDGAQARMVAERARIDQRNLRFVPNAVVVVPGSEIEFLNSDSVRHNVFSPRRGGAGFDLGTYRSGEHRVRAFMGAGAYVILCDVHPEMAAHVYVVDSPLHALTDSTGRYRIAGVPPGEYLLEVRYRRRALGRLTLRVVQGDTARVDVALTDERAARRARER